MQTVAIKSRIYALYKGDKYVCDGTLGELSKVTGLKPETLYFYSMPTYRRRIESYHKETTALVTVRLDEEQ